MTTKIIKGVDNWYGKIHPYLISTSRAKHPVHMIEGGSILTTDMITEFKQSGDMGVFGLNKKDYEWFKTHLTNIEVEVEK